MSLRSGTVRIPAIVSLVLAACSGPVGPDLAASCIAVLQFEGSVYAVADHPAGGEIFPGASVGAVARNLGCDDTPEPGAGRPEPLLDGDSNFLPPGTAVHSVEGFDVSQALAVRPDTIWIFLRPIQP